MYSFSRFGALLGAVALLATTAAFAQYKYTGPDGRVIYSDVPPPANAKGVQKPAVAGNSAPSGNSAGLPFALQQAVKTFPVTLYTTNDCEACNNGRSLLNKRGIPFSEKTVRTQDDIKIFKEATKAEQVPVMMVGNGRQVGFEEGAWNSALTIAGYPPNSLLPATFKNGPPLPAAPFTPETKSAATPPPAPGQAAGPTDAGSSTASAPPPPSGGKPPAWFKGF